MSKADGAGTHLEQPPVFVVGAGAVSAFGFEWRGLGRALEDNRLTFSPSRQLAQSHPQVMASEVYEIPASREVSDGRARKLMSRSAHLSAIAMNLALHDAGWQEGRESIGLYCGVGASGGAMQELTPMLRASIEGGQFSEARFGSQGLAACNPLFAFQLMNNLTLCHGAMLSGLAGPNSAFFSRGNGTVVALSEAIHALKEGDCQRALVGGADTALHPVTWEELVRAGRAHDGLVPAEGAAMLALAVGVTAEPPLAVVEHCEFRGSEPRGQTHQQVALSDWLASLPAVDLVLLAPWGIPARAMLYAAAASVSTLVGVRTIDLSLGLGDCLAATPALAWAAALDLLVAQRARRVLILNAGVDCGVGAVILGAAQTAR